MRTQEQKGKNGFQAVSAMSSLPVLAVEGEEGNTSGAAQRCVLKSCYLLLVNNYQNQRQLKIRGAKLGVKWTGLKTRAEERREGKEVSNRKTRKGVARKEEEPQGGGGVVHVTRYVEVGEDCSALVREYLGLDEAFCIIGSNFPKHFLAIILILQAFTPVVT